MRFKTEYRSIWECGQRVDTYGNPHQEDSIFPVHNSNEDNASLFILCDGMGGHERGEVASSLVCNSMSSFIGKDTDIFNNDILVNALESSYNLMDKYDDQSDKKMGTTLALLKLHQGGATIAHIGDSRVYHIRPGKDGESTQILFVTNDHSLVNDLVKIGELTPEEAKTSKQRHIITRAMQPGNHCKAEVYETTDILPGDYFYLCSDGMLEQMEDEAIRNIFSHSGGNIGQKVDILCGATSGNKDNHSAILVLIEDVVVETQNQSTDDSVVDVLDITSKSTFKNRWKNIFKS